MTEITEAEAIEQARQFHARSKKFSGRNLRGYVGLLKEMVREPGWSLLDYGCGKAGVWYSTNLLGELRLSRLSLYDPAMPANYARYLHSSPRHDVVICIHVLEHIPPAAVAPAVDLLLELAGCALLVVVPTTPSDRLLPNGMNAHLTVRPRGWWEHLFLERRAACERADQIDFRWVIE